MLAIYTNFPYKKLAGCLNSEITGAAVNYIIAEHKRRSLKRFLYPNSSEITIFLQIFHYFKL